MEGQGDDRSGDAGETVLSGAVRERLIALATDVLPDLPSSVLSPRLRAVARFTPARRLRAAAPLLAVELDAQEKLREALLDRLHPSSPADSGNASDAEDSASRHPVVAAVLAGAVPAVADPVDVAAIAFLGRPPGWRALVARAQSAVTQHAERGDAQALRTTVAAARAERDAARARLRTALAAETRRTDALHRELRESGREVRRLTGALRDAQRERDMAREESAGRAAAAAAAGTAAAAEIRRLRSRLADAERAVDVIRRDARQSRGSDDARLWLLLQTASGAIRGLQDELALATPAIRPADTVAARRPDPGADTRIDRPDELERVLRLPAAHALVDGYNVTKTGYGELTLMAQRDRLVSALAALAGQTGAEMTCVFDGADRPPVMPSVPRGVRVLFSEPGEQADELIRRLAAAEPLGRVVLIVSSDNEVAAAARRPGGYVVPSRVALERLNRS